MTQLLPPAPVILIREMGLTHAEFFRTLPSAMGDQTFSVSDLTVTTKSEAHRLTIKLAPEQERRIGFLRLPVTWVTFEFVGHTQDDIDSFMRRFERRFQRGGG
jgi:hypothetical protein